MPSNNMNAFLSSFLGQKGLGGGMQRISQLMQEQDRLKADEANRQFLQEMAEKRFGLAEDAQTATADYRQDQLGLRKQGMWQDEMNQAMDYRAGQEQPPLSEFEQLMNERKLAKVDAEIAKLQKQTEYIGRDKQAGQPGQTSRLKTMGDYEAYVKNWTNNPDNIGSLPPLTQNEYLSARGFPMSPQPKRSRLYDISPKDDRGPAAGGKFMQPPPQMIQTDMPADWPGSQTEWEDYKRRKGI